MIRHVYNRDGTKLLRREEAEPVCGEDFCDACGDCLHCYYGDGCCSGERTEHWWVVYEDEKETQLNEKQKEHQMNTITHPELVAALKKPGDQIIKELTPGGADLLHMAVGVSGEAGELLDAVKKKTIYNKPLDIENVIEELGDLEFYMEGIRQILCITREQCLEHNIAKLSKRYAAGKFSNEQAAARADKAQ